MSDLETRERRRRKMKQANKKHRRNPGSKRPQPVESQDGDDWMKVKLSGERSYE